MRKEGFLKRHLPPKKDRCYQSENYKSSVSFLCYFLPKITTLIILVRGSKVWTAENIKPYRLKSWNMIITENVGTVTFSGLTEYTILHSVANI